MSAFVRIPDSLLLAMASDHEDIPKMYHHPNPLLRHFFWSRLHRLNRYIARYGKGLAHCLDFGCGNGIMLATLSKAFPRVSGLDRHTHLAQKVVESLSLPNVTLHACDVQEFVPPDGAYDMIIAADVLEHFPELTVPVGAISQWLKPGGYLLTSLPTENWLYVFLRKVFGVEKPPDHYHTAAQVEAYLKSQGFTPLARQYVPFNWAWTPLFRITAWQKGGSA